MAKAKTLETVRVVVEIADTVDVAAVRTLSAAAGLGWRPWYMEQIERRVREAFQGYPVDLLGPFAYEVGFVGEPWSDTSPVQDANDEGETILVPILWDTLRGKVLFDVARDNFAWVVGGAYRSTGWVGADLMSSWTNNRVREQERRDRRTGFLSTWSDVSNATASVFPT
jgi:hypothetical protein